MTKNFIELVTQGEVEVGERKSRDMVFKTDFSDLLYSILNDYLEVKSNFPIGQCNVDFFIPSLGLVIEYNKADDVTREEYIVGEFIKWEKILLDETEFKNYMEHEEEVITILNIKKGSENAGIKEIMKIVSECGFNVLNSKTNRIFNNIENLYDYYDVDYNLESLEVEIANIGYKIK